MKIIFKKERLFRMIAKIVAKDILEQFLYKVNHTNMEKDEALAYFSEELVDALYDKRQR